MRYLGVSHNGYERNPMTDLLAAESSLNADGILEGLGSFLAANPLLTLILIIVLICLIKFR